MMYNGTVARWNRTKGIGFLSCPDFQGDVFVHVSSFGGGDLVEGGEVSFEVEEEPNGKRRAVRVEGPAVQTRDRAPAADTLHHGTVARWNSSKGIGFLSCPDFQGDVFVHVSSFGGGDLVEGGEVSFGVEDQPNGKRRAINVQGPAVTSSQYGNNNGYGGGGFNQFSRGYGKGDRADGYQNGKGKGGKGSKGDRYNRGFGGSNNSPYTGHHTYGQES